MTIALSGSEYKALVSAMATQPRQSLETMDIFYQDSDPEASESSCQITSFGSAHYGVHISFFK